MADGLITPGLVIQVAKAVGDYRITPAEFGEIIGTVSSIFVGAFVLGALGMLIGGLNRWLMS